MAGNATQESGSGRQFRATQTWNVLVLQLKKCATMKKRRNTKKVYNECFTGTNAVDVLHEFVKTHPQHFKNSITISRENIVRLCQSFLDMRIMQKVMETDLDKIDKFEDSSSSMYAFIDELDKDNNDRKSVGRPVLREIDGDIRNSLDHISISRKHGSLTLRRKRRPHLFSAMSSGKEHSTTPNKSSPTKSAATHSVKRSSSLVRRVVKRASSNPDLTSDNIQLSSSSENDDDVVKGKKSSRSSGVKLGFSQRLSFRRKSASLDLSGETSGGLHACSDEASMEVTRRSSISTNTHQLFVNKWSRRSFNIKENLTKIMQRSQTYQVNSSAHSEDRVFEGLPAKTSTKRHLVAFQSDMSPLKIAKKQEEKISETPKCRRTPRTFGYRKPFSEYANRVTIKRQSVRKKEQPTETEPTTYVITNSLAMEDELRTKSKSLTAQDMDLVRRECVRVRLLQLLDLSFVEDVIASPPCPKERVACSSAGDRYNKLATLFDSDDRWISSALAVISRISDGCSILKKIVEGNETDYKIQLFFAIYNHYKSLPYTLVPTAMLEIINAIIHTLETKPANESVELVQLFIHLLTEDQISELNNLFTFLQCVANDDDVVLSSRCNNKLFLLQLFPSIIFPAHDKSCDVSSGPAGLVQFIMENPVRSFTLPPTIGTAVQRKQQLMESGQILSPTMIRDVTFSTMITKEDYESQKEGFTQKQISNLAKFVAETSSPISARKKKDFLKKLQSTHSSAYATVRLPNKIHHPIASSSEGTSRNFLKVHGTSTLPRRSKKKKPVV